MNWKRWSGPIILLAALVIGERTYLYRPDHKYRLTVEVETPDGVRSSSGLMSVHPNRAYRGSGIGPSGPITKGDAVFVDLGARRNVVALLLHGTNPAETDGMNYLPLRALAANGKRIDFRDTKHQTGIVPLTGALIPTLVSFGDTADPKTARLVDPADLSGSLGQGYKLKAVSLAVVPTGMWPLDVGGFMGEPITRTIDRKLPWSGDSASAFAALNAAGLVLAKSSDANSDPVAAFRSQ